ncbi:Uncharacterised protein [Streptococcus pneumoniae]|nr:Uncharacterised protein [Streptococcus pneumoniae]
MECFVTPHALFKINKATTTEIIGSAIYHENNDISTPATNAPTDPKASPRTCKYALRKFTLFFTSPCLISAHALIKFASKPIDAINIIGPLETVGGSKNRPIASHTISPATTNNVIPLINAAKISKR